MIRRELAVRRQPAAGVLDRVGDRRRDLEARELGDVGRDEIDTLRQGEYASVSALLVSGTDSVTAMIGPVTFLAANALTLAAGDVIDISGSKMLMAGKPMLMATEIRKGETRVVLRDKATGAPAWPQAGVGMVRKP